MVSRPHGGKLVNRVAAGKERGRRLDEISELPKIVLPLELAVDVGNIAYGVFSPLEGFVNYEDYTNVLTEMRLSDDTPWTIPLTLDVGKETVDKVKEGDEVALFYRDEPIALLKIDEKYKMDKDEHAKNVYGTLDEGHPGVRKTQETKDYLLGGSITLVDEVENSYEKYTLRPLETRILFEERGWKYIVGFQTRNAPHLGHEYVQKAALTFTDGLFINPLVGWKKEGDYKDDVILNAYELLIKHYFPGNVVVLAVLRTAMRYAGPREAIFHSIMRKNFGCTHFIVGRDHAGVGNYYGPYDAWEIFKQFPDLGITPLFIRNSFYCSKCGGMTNEKICPHPEEYRTYISGSNLRGMIKHGLKPPETVMRREVASEILKCKEPFI